MNLIHNEKVDVSRRLNIDVIDDKGKNNLTISLMFNWSYGELGIIINYCFVEIGEQRKFQINDKVIMGYMSDNQTRTNRGYFAG